jgi:cytoskeletal protein CcmA (bactofilin family)
MENIVFSPSGNVSLRINDDKMSAWMYLHKNGKIIDEREILNLIEESGIRYGFEDALEWMADNGYNKDFEKPFPVAICKTAVNKEQIRLLFNPEKSYNPEKEWNFKDIVNWTCVEPGRALADIPLTDLLNMDSSINIFGEPASAVADLLTLNSYLGNNVSLDSEGKKIISVTRGYPYVDSENRVCIAENVHYKGDIKFINIPMTLGAALTVEGSINKTKLSMTRDLHVKGNIISSEIYTEGNLTVDGDILECQASGIVVTQDIKVKSISDSLVLCMGNIIFGENITGSRIIAEKQLIGNPETSRITASQVMSYTMIDVANIGSEEGSETEVEITVSPFLKERLSQMTKVLDKLSVSPNLNADSIDKFGKKLKMVEEDFSRELNKFLNNKPPQPRFVKVRNQLFKKTYVRVFKNSHFIKQNQSNVEFNEA